MQTQGVKWAPRGSSYPSQHIGTWLINTTRYEISGKRDGTPLTGSGRLSVKQICQAEFATPHPGSGHYEALHALAMDLLFGFSYSQISVLLFLV